MASTLSGSTEDIKKLQAQVDQLRERLDFISPMLPLVNFVQDFIQKVECEASLQLLRLKNAQVLRPKQPGEEDEISNAQLETVKYFHFLTDAITAIHASGGAGTSAGTGCGGVGMASWSPGTASAMSQDASPTVAAACPTSAVSRGSSGPLASRAPSGPLGGGPPGPASSAGAFGGGCSSPSARGSLAASTLHPQSLTFGTSPGLDSQGAGQRSEGRGGSDGGFLLAGGMGPATARGFVGSSAASSSRAGDPRGSPGGLGLGGPAHSPPRGSSGHPAGPGAEPCLLTEPLAEPGTGGTNGGGYGGSSNGSHSSDLDGIVLGRGSWASAFRQASGPRREALRLLCKSGIVTARELSDDLTVISQEHIDECVQIASEMLQTWTLDMWAQQPAEAKKFFEARLTALYQRKFGEQKS